jgi:hypothetical protein
MTEPELGAWGGDREGEGGRPASLGAESELYTHARLTGVPGDEPTPYIQFDLPSVGGDKSHLQIVCWPDNDLGVYDREIDWTSPDDTTWLGMDVGEEYGGVAVPRDPTPDQIRWPHPAVPCRRHGSAWHPDPVPAPGADGCRLHPQAESSRVVTRTWRWPTDLAARAADMSGRRRSAQSVAQGEELCPLRAGERAHRDRLVAGVFEETVQDHG